MRDGVTLSTDIYLPDVDDTVLPTVLIRTPYNKATYDHTQFPNSERIAVPLFAGQGFAVVVQDKRGKFESGGEYMIAKGDAQDGYDTIEWISKQKWSNGRVGTYGCSYAGELQIYLAQATHPSHRAMIPQAAGGANGTVDGRYRFFGTRVYGAIELAATVGWHTQQNASKVYADVPSDLGQSEWARIAPMFSLAPMAPELDLDQILRRLPISKMLEGLDIAPSDFVDYVTRDLTDPYWDQFDYLEDDSIVDTPALHINSWYDFGVEDTLFQFNFFRAHGASERTRNNQYVIISPTRHCASETETNEVTKIGDPDVEGARVVGDSRFPFYETYLNWFRYWLMDDTKAIASLPRVQYYVMGLNRWKSADTWPVPGTAFTKYYLRSSGRANSLYGDGRLSLTPSNTKEQFDQFSYDPEFPVRSLGGAICCTQDARDGAFDQRPNEVRNDVLVYSSDPLGVAVELTGPITLRLYVSSSVPDTDFVAKLIDVYPDGTAFNVQEGILRARYRNGMDRPALMKPGEIYPIDITLGATSNYFHAGHRIRLEVTSSNFPRFDRNLNTGGNNHDESEWTVATNRVHHDAKYSSYLLLPVAPANKQ